MIRESKLHGIYTDGRRFYTKSLAGNMNVYGEFVKSQGKDHFREWNPFRSKIGAALAKKVSQLGIKPGSTVLYLGAASGTTVSHVADIVGKEGGVFALEFSSVSMRQLFKVINHWKNTAPIYANASFPEKYKHLVSEVDVVFQDISQRHQVDMFKWNCDAFLKKGGFGLLCVKARSIDITKKPSVLFKQIGQELEKTFTIVDKRSLDPFQKDHYLFVVKKR